MAAFFRSKVEEHLTCSVCLGQYKNPKVLPCLHSYCHECIVKLVKHAKSFACPECRTTVKIDDPKNLSNLPSNFFVNNLLATMSLTDDKKVKKILCENCESENVAETRCKECCIFLCRYCTEFHKISRPTKHHGLLSMDELKSGAGPDSIAEKIRCSKHKEEVIKLYCKTCHVTICRDCTIVDHREHAYGFVEEVALQEKQKLQANLEEVKRRKVRVVSGIANLKRFNAGLVAKKQATISQINSHFDELARVTAFRKLELVERAEWLTKLREKQIQSQLQQLEVALASCESSIDFTERAFKNGNDVQILSMENFISRSLENLKRVNDQTEPCVGDDIVFATPLTVKDTRKRLLNLFTVNIPTENSKACFDKPKDDLEQGKQSSITVTCHDKSNRRLWHGGQMVIPTFSGVRVSGVTVTDNNDGSHTVKFIPDGVGLLKFEVIIDGNSVPTCSLTKNIKWVLSYFHGSGTISNGGLTMTSQRDQHGGYGGYGGYGEDRRVGECYFESGIHSWKVRVGEHQNRGYGGNTVVVGVIDYKVIKPKKASKAKPAVSNPLSNISSKKMWVMNVNAMQGMEISLTLNMENHTLEISSHNYGRQQHEFSAERVCPYFAISSQYGNTSISLVK